MYNSDSLSVKAVVISLLVIITCLGCSSKEKDAESPSVKEIDLLSLVSVQAPGWRQEKTMIIVKPEDMKDYMGSKAELYFAYSFRRLAVGKYKNEMSLPMLVEVYEFDSSENAYGIYSFDMVGNRLNIGQDALYGHGLLRFWKDKLLVRVIAEEEYKDLEDDVFAFGRQVDSKILTTGSKPRLLSLVPEENLVPRSLHFFHKNICLNNIHYIPESVELGLSEYTNAVTAYYAFGGKQPPLLLLIEYPGESEAKTASKRFGDLYLRAEPMSATDVASRSAMERLMNIVRMGPEEYSSMALTQNFLILVFEAHNSEICKILMAKTLTKIELYGKSIGQ